MPGFGLGMTSKSRKPTRSDGVVEECDLLWGGNLRAVKCEFLGRRFTIYYLDSPPQFCRVSLMIQRLHFCLLCSFVILVISSFISGRAGEVESLHLTSSRALIFSNISVGTGSVLSRCCPEGGVMLL